MNLQKIASLSALILSYTINSMYPCSFKELKDYYLLPFRGSEVDDSDRNQQDRPLQKQALTMDERCMMETLGERYITEKHIKKLIQSIPLPETIVSFASYNPNIRSAITNKTLKHLNYFSNLNHLILNDTQLQDFSGTEYLYRLTVLSYKGNINLTSFKGLEKTRLNRLIICDCSNLHTIGKNTLPSTLESLEVDHCGLASLDGLEHCTNLKVLILNDNKIKNVTPLLPLIKEGTLEKMNLSNNPLCLKKLNNLLKTLTIPNIIHNPERTIKEQEIILYLQALLLKKVDEEILILENIKKSTEEERKNTQSTHECLRLFKVFSLMEEIKKKNNEKI